MVPNSSHMPDDNTEPKLPPALVDDLRAAFVGRVAVPDEVDARVRAAARQAFVHQRRRRMVARWIQATTAAAAAITLAVWLTSEPASVKPVNAPGSQSPALTGKFESPGVTPLDPSRKPDILDAFALARRIEAQAELDAGWDVNGDGRVDRQDVDTLAARAVSLEERVIQ